MEYYEHNPGDHDDPVAGPTWLTALVAVVLFLVIIFGVTAMFYSVQLEEVRVKLLDREPLQLQLYRQEQQQLLAGEPHWVEETVGDQVIRRYVIPIDQAMDRVIEEYAR